MTKEERTVEQKRIARLEKQYLKAEAAVEELRSDNSSIFEEYGLRILERNAALDQLLRACREDKTGTEDGLVMVSIVRQRDFNGRRLYEALEKNPKLRTELVNLEYKVNIKAFDHAVSHGAINPTDGIDGYKNIIKIMSAPKIITMD